MRWTWRPAKKGDRFARLPFNAKGERKPYTVAKIILGAKVVYEAWRKDEDTGFGHCLSRHADADAAMGACELHAQEYGV